MKKVIFLIGIAFFIGKINAQVGINTTTPDASSALDVTSTNKGMLVPRMLEAQRIAITTPATGLLVYQIDNTDGFWYYDGIAWVSLNGSASPSEFQRFGNIIRNTTDITNDDFLFGSTSLNDLPGSFDLGERRMFFDKSLGAFRAGRTTSSEWDSGNVGTNSVAMGSRTKASGLISTALGSSTTASGLASTAFGGSTLASGNYATSIGQNTTASGEISTALGFQNTASSYAETVLGLYATEYVPNSTTTVSPDDRLFTIGNGVNIFSRSDAMKVFKNGHVEFPTSIDASGTPGSGVLEIANSLRLDGNEIITNTNAPLYIQNDNNGDLFVDGSTLSVDASENKVGIGTTTPSATLDIVGSFQFADGSQAAGRVLTSDADGNATWAILESDTDWFVVGSNIFSGITGNVGIGTSSPSDKLVVSGGRVEFTEGTDASGTPGSGVLEIANTLRIDGNEIITNNETTLFLQRDNQGDLVVDNNTFMVDASENRVGIGTSTPSARLEVAAGRVEFTGNAEADGTPGSGVLEIDNSLRLDGDEIVTNTGTTLSLQSGNNGDLRVDGSTLVVDSSANRVGIGTSSPTQAKLVVNGSARNDLTVYSYFNIFAPFVGINVVADDYSIYTSHKIATSELHVFSDARIKNIKNVSNTKEDLETLAQIEITNYTLKDSIGMGKETIKKVIAQQVKEVYPQAVSNDLTDVIPNIYQLSEINDGWINLQTDLVVGDKVKLIFSETEELFEVTEVSTTAFKVNSEQEGKVFVFGTEVQDFHTVDYEAISMLNVSATQELLKRIEFLESENSNLKADNNGLKKDNEKQNVFLTELDVRLQQIEENLKNQANQSTNN